MQPAADARAALVSWQRRGEAGATGLWRFPAGLAVFAGHFPGEPLLPGVCQLAAADLLLQLACPGWRLAAVLRVKWTAPVRPDRELAIALHWRRATTLEADATMTVDGAEVATARLRYRSEGAPDGAPSASADRRTGG